MSAAERNTPRTTSWYLVEIELKRVQTYLFQVPRLSVMVGANALLGETLRGLWCGEDFDRDIPSLPVAAKPLSDDDSVIPPASPLSPGRSTAKGEASDCGAVAKHTGARLPEEVSVELWSAVEEAHRDLHDKDPLRYPPGENEIWQDDVSRVAMKTGVLVRDGGHFEAVFPSREKAVAFVNRAHELIQQRVPGILLDTRIRELVHDGQVWRKKGAAEEGLRQESGVSLLDLPQARVCEFSGEGPASEPCAVTDRAQKSPVVSHSVHARHERGRAFDRGETRDVLGILRPRLLRDLGFPETAQSAFPADFTELSTHGYLAVLHVDGNGVGQRSNEYAATAGEDFFESWRVRERFYHTLRIGMRIAVTQAFTSVFRGKRSRSGKIPARLLMLGGDDLVLVCGAVYALPFVVELARCVSKNTASLPGGRGPITLGAGVAIVQDSFPFYRAYELADQLASSAKRLKAALPEDEGNVVDWLVTSEAWYGDVEATRRSQYIVDGQLVLSAKPYRILKSPQSPGKSLEELLDDAGKLSRDRVARGQLHGLATALRLGRHSASFAAAMLPDELRSALTKSGYLHGDEGPWRSLPWPSGGPAPPQGQQDGTRFLTQVLDLFELYELHQLAERAEGPAAEGPFFAASSPSANERAEASTVADGERS